MQRKTILLSIMLFFFSGVFAQIEPVVDPLDLAATLLADGYTQRAKTVIEKIDISAEEFDFARYYTLKGILLQRESYPTLSNIFLHEALARGQKNQSTYLYIARNNWDIEDYIAVLDALDKAGDTAKQSADMYIIKAESLKRTDQIELAWSVLLEAERLFPEETRFTKQKFYYLVELGFYQQAQETIDVLLANDETTANDYLSFSYVLRENNQTEFALRLLEEAQLRFPNDARLTELLGQVYIDEQNYTSAALVYDYVSLNNFAFADKAAPLYLKANQPVRSLQLNRRVVDQKEKFRQRIGIDIYFEDYEALVAKEDAIFRYDLYQDENIVYALAFAHFRNGDYENASNYAKRIQSDRLYQQAISLLNEIEKCKKTPDVCF